MPTWSGIIQDLESGKASKPPNVDDGDLVLEQVPVKGRFGDIRMMGWDGVIGTCRYKGGRIGEARGRLVRGKGGGG